MEKTEFTIEKTTVECYKIRHDYGYWADITVDSQGSKGRISISSDFGNYANFWGACGSSFKKFLIDLNLDYAADKFGADRWFDQENTLKGYRIHILDYRKDETISAQLARLLWNEIEELEECSSKSEFEITISNCSNLMRLFDHCPEIDYGITPQFRKFWDLVWPVFIDQIKSEMIPQPCEP